MKRVAIWEQFGESITRHRWQTLSAYLGHETTQLELKAKAIPFPTDIDFRSDRVFDPNPHQLKLAEDQVEIELLIKSLAVWGPDTLIQAAASCAQLQIQSQSGCRDDLVGTRDEVFHAVQTYIHTMNGDDLGRVTVAAKRCDAIYSEYADRPDDPESQATWSHLGAPWFAAETIIEDYQLQKYDGSGPVEASPTWCNRVTVWPARAAEVAAEWSSFEKVNERVRGALLTWILN